MKNLKSKFVILPILSLALCSCGKVDEYKHLLIEGDANVILLIGQSNASGNSPYEYLENTHNEVYNTFLKGTDNVLTSYYVHSSNHIEYFEPTRFGMADSSKFFGPEVGIADVFRKENTTTYIIKYAIGGTTLDDQWLDTKMNRGDLYNGSIEWFKEKLGYLQENHVNPHLIGMFWMQGEGDSHSGLEYKYEENLKHMISYYREDLKDYYVDHLNFVDAYISTKTAWPNPVPVNECKQKVADSDPHNFVIKTNGEDETAIDLNLKRASNQGEDAAHYDAQSELLLGQTAGTIIKNNM